MNRRSPFTAGPRRGVTLVEMMVAGAMCVLIMWLLAWCYQQGLDSFRNVRAQGDLMAREQMAVSILLRDLGEPHFLEEDGRPDSGRLRGQRLDRIVVANGKATGYTPPRSGYFWARSLPVDSVNNFDEGTDADGLASSRSTNHALQFTTILPGGAPHNIYTVNVAGKQWAGRAAEISYFLVRIPGEATPGGGPLFNLHRRWRLAALNTDDGPGYNQAFTDAAAVNPRDFPSEVMTALDPGPMRTLRELTVPAGFANSTSYRLAPFSPMPVTSTRYGEDVLISKVISFEVKFTGTAGRDGNGQPIPWPAPFPGNSDGPFDTLPFNGEFDTFSALVPNWDAQANVATLPGANSAGNANAVMKPLCLRAVMIRIRVWDARTQQTRQTTLIQDL